MQPKSSIPDDLSLWLAGAAAAATVVSIAAFEILLALALIALIIQKRLRLPPIAIPLALWFVLTLISAAASGQARDAMPQVKKFYVYLMLLAVYSAFRQAWQMRLLLGALAAGATLSALWSFVQFAHKVQVARQAHENFYASYVGARITGFMGHWMTFSGEMMIVLLLISAFLFFAERRLSLPLLAAACVITVALLAGFTRSMWLGALVGGVYLLWFWQKRVLLALPVLGGLLLAANPFSLRDRVVSSFEPHGEMDSNEHRVITRRVGYRMIQAHPWLGVGPEEVGKQFEAYLPEDVPWPLPPGYYGHLHNIYVHYAAERGIPAALALLWAIGLALWDFIGAARRELDQRVQWVLHGAIAVILAVMVSGFYELNLGDSEVLGLFLSVLGIGYGALKQAASKPISAEWKPVSTLT